MHKMISRSEIDQVIKKAANLKALVIGDVMLDQYIHGQVDRISPEAPVPVLSHLHTEFKAGGAANVALNLAAWGCRTTLVGMTGLDENAKVLSNLLDKQGILHQFYSSGKRPTTVKTRVVASSHHLLRIDHEVNEYLDHDEEKAVENLILAILQSDTPDLIIMEDYNKGLLTPDLIRFIIQEGKKRGAFIAVDPKDKHFFTYTHVDLFKPNLREASQAAHQHLQPIDLEALSTKWRNEMNINTIAITLGGNGVFLQTPDESRLIPPGKSIDVMDVCGAGDAVICALALGQMSGLSADACGGLGNATGGYVCSHSGVVVMDVDLIYQWI